MCGEELEWTGDRPFDTWTLPSPVRKILWPQALKYPHGVCAHLIHTESSLDTEPPKKKVSPAGASEFAWVHRTGTYGARPRPAALLLGRSHLTFASLLQIGLDHLVIFSQILLRVSMFNCLGFVLAAPCLKLLIDCSSPCFRGRGTESSLCFEEVEVKYTFIFYCDFFRTTFYKMPCITYCFWKGKFH